MCEYNKTYICECISLVLVRIMGANQYDKALRFIKKLKETFKTNEIDSDMLISEIRKQIGNDEKRVVRPYIKLMLSNKLITQEAGSNIVKLCGEDGSN